MAAVGVLAVYVWIAVATNRSQRAAVFLALLDDLQAPRMRGARKVLYDAEDQEADICVGFRREAAELVCHTFNTAGFLARTRQVRAKHLIALWGPSILRVREVCDPLIRERRDRNTYPNELAPFIWEDFDWLAAKTIARWPRTLKHAERIKQWGLDPAVLKEQREIKAHEYKTFGPHYHRGPPW